MLVQLVDFLKRLEGGARRGGGAATAPLAPAAAPLLALPPRRCSPPALLSPDAAAPRRAEMKVLGHKIELLTGTAGPRRPLRSAVERERGAAAGGLGGSGSGVRREGGDQPVPSRCAARSRAQPGPARPRPAPLSAGVWSVCGRSPGPGSDPLAFPSSGAPVRSPKGERELSLGHGLLFLLLVTV